DVVAISIPLVTSDIPKNPLKTGFVFTDIRPMLIRLVAIVRQQTDALVVAGGGGFNYFPSDWLFCLDIDFGLVGECEVSFPQFLDACSHEKALRLVPGIIIRSGENMYTRPWQESTPLDAMPLPAYHLFDTSIYNRMNVPWGMVTKRGCSFGCSYCSSSFAPGQEYRFKSLDRIMKEIHHIKDNTGASAVNFCDTSFNCPITHVKALCRTLTEAKIDIDWRSGTFKPLGISPEFCKLLALSGCTFAGLSIETACSRLLANMNRGYRKDDIRSALDNLGESGIDHGISLVIGGPGETMASIRETFDLVESYPDIKAVWINIGVFGLKRHMENMMPASEKSSQKPGLFQDAWYISPELDPDEMEDFVDTLGEHKNYLVQINTPWS
ncbi:MAG: radical SAM protein, partial [Desulfobacteraceae bacterium]|nr:radical SAM protein [Desulfobacteraceae bacterium]